MKKALEIALGITTSIGGFLDAGALATAIAAGAVFGYSLIWAFCLGTVCVICLVEMSGRLAIASQHTIISAVRQRFGWRLHCLLYCVNLALDLLILASEIGGICIALQLSTGVGFRWWAFPSALLIWVLLWRGNFNLIENGVALLGLITLCFAVAAWKLHPASGEVLRSLLPAAPRHDAVQYWFLAVSILGALISPYLCFFYSSGAIEDKWDTGYLGVNRAVASLGMGFGNLVAVSVVIVAALTLKPMGILGDSYHQGALMLTSTFGRWGFGLFTACVFVACLGASLEVSLDTAYDAAQTFGWNWGENQHPRQAARFNLVYTLILPLAALPIFCGADPLKLTLFSMAITAVALPLVTMPFLVLLNDETLMGEHRNGPLGNTVVALTIALAFVVGIVSIPLQIMGGS